MIYPLKAEITSPFGDRIHPITGEFKFHNGVDFGAPTGTPIKAPANGTVESIYSNSTGGKQLVIKHNFGFKTGYAHLNAYNVEEGQKVKQGEIIAFVGNTGASTGAHLHFTVKKNGEYIDPIKKLKADKLKVILMAISVLLLITFILFKSNVIKIR